MSPQPDPRAGSSDVRVRFAAPPDLDVGAVLALVGGARQTSDRSAWWATRTPAGTASVRLHLHDPETVSAEAWGPGASAILLDAQRLVTADEASGFESHHEVISDLQRRRLNARFPRTHRVFDALVDAVLGQKVQTASASASRRAICARYGEEAPGPMAMSVLPSPERWAELGYADLHPCNVEKRRAATILSLARRSEWLESLSRRTPDQRRRALTSLHGVGPWTAAVVAQVAWADADAVPVGDFHLPNMVAWALAGEQRGTDARMFELLEPYAGHRGRVLRILKSAGVHAPRHGPKLGISDIRGL